MYIEKDCAYYTAMAQRHYMEVNLKEAQEYAAWAQGMMAGVTKYPKYKKVLHLIDFQHEIGAQIQKSDESGTVRVLYTYGRTERFASVAQAEKALRARGFMTRQEKIHQVNAAKSFQR